MHFLWLGKTEKYLLGLSGHTGRLKMPMLSNSITSVNNIFMFMLLARSKTFSHIPRRPTLTRSNNFKMHYQIPCISFAVVSKS